MWITSEWKELQFSELIRLQCMVPDVWYINASKMQLREERCLQEERGNCVNDYTTELCRQLPHLFEPVVSKCVAVRLWHQNRGLPLHVIVCTLYVNIQSVVIMWSFFLEILTHKISVVHFPCIWNRLCFWSWCFTSSGPWYPSNWRDEIALVSWSRILYTSTLLMSNQDIQWVLIEFGHNRYGLTSRTWGSWLFKGNDRLIKFRAGCSHKWDMLLC